MKLFFARRHDEQTNIVYHSAHISMDMKILHTLAIGWSRIKGDWWYESDPKNKKFLSIGSVLKNGIARKGIYIGRLGIVLMSSDTSKINPFKG